MEGHVGGQHPFVLDSTFILNDSYFLQQSEDVSEDLGFGFETETYKITNPQQQRDIFTIHLCINKEKTSAAVKAHQPVFNIKASWTPHRSRLLHLVITNLDNLVIVWISLCCCSTHTLI